MKSRRFALLLAILFLLTAVIALSPLAARAATPTISWLNPPPGGIVELQVGESYTVEIQVSSDTEFLSATAMPDQYFPGRGVFYHGGDRVGRGTSALLQLTMTGKGSTANLPDGLAPVAAVVGVRYPGGVVFTQRFDFFVRVLP